MPRLVMRMKRVLEVDAGEDGEHVGLDGGHEDLQTVDRDHPDDRGHAGRAHDAGEAREDLENGVTRQ